MARRIRVGVLFGGRSGEHDVSLRSAQAVMRAIDRGRFEVVPIGITRDGRWLVGGDPLRALAVESRLPLELDPGGGGEGRGREPVARAGTRALAVTEPAWTGSVDVVFPVLHGPNGEDGTVQGLLELANIPYVGCGVLASAVAMDKPTAKRLFAAAGLPIARWFAFTWREWLRDRAAIVSRIERELSYPCFVKPANLGSSVGVSKVRQPGRLAEAVEAASRFDRKIVVEEAIDARELEVSVLGNDDPLASVVGEVVPAREFYDYEAKYLDDRSQLLIPAPISQEQAKATRAMALAAFKAIDGAGMARVDFFLERQSGRILVNEVNTIPGFTAISMYPKLWEASGLSFRDLVTRLIELALERHEERACRYQS
jgi:D-alanine-D-alanine ligase